MRDPYRQLARAAESLGPAVDEFDRKMSKAAASKSMQRVATVVRPPRLPKTRAHRPTPHRAALPVPYTRGMPPTVLDRVRALEEQRSGGNSIMGRVRRGANRVASAIRHALSRVHDALARLRDRLARRTR